MEAWNQRRMDLVYHPTSHDIFIELQKRAHDMETESKHSGSIWTATPIAIYILSVLVDSGNPLQADYFLSESRRCRARARRSCTSEHVHSPARAASVHLRVQTQSQVVVIFVERQMWRSAGAGLQHAVSSDNAIRTGSMSIMK